MTPRLKALWLRFTDLVKSFGAAPYEYYNSQGLGHSVSYSLSTALVAADAIDGTKTGRIPIWVNGEKFTFQFDKLGRRRLPKALRDRLA